MKFETVVAGIVMAIWGPQLLVVLILFPLVPVLIPLFLWFAYENYKDKKHQEMAIATNAISPGTYCDECFSKLAGNLAEHPHTYACSHSKQLFIPDTKRSQMPW
jgi:hypothetical protein